MNNTEKKKLPLKVKTALAVSAVAVVLAAVIVVIVHFTGAFKPENNSIVVYKKGTESIVRIGKLEEKVADPSASGFKADKESERVFYTVESSYSNGLYDLYYIEKKRSEISKPKIIDIGIDKNFSIASGKIYYLKKNVSAGAYEGCVCDISENIIETFSGNVESVYPLGDTGDVYFTKMHGANLVLYKFSDGSPEEICRNLVNIRCYGEGEKPHIIYEVSSQIHNGMKELYIAFAAESPQLICDNTYEVMYDNYTGVGNLYYFTSSSENISWSYVIADAYSESDKSVVKPKRTDFLALFGLSEEYNKAFKEYQRKLIRDEIRVALNESVEKGEFSVPVFNAFAYNSEGSFKVAENIDPSKVYTVSALGVPKIIYEKSEVLTAETDMDSLVEIAQRSTMGEVIDYARTVVAESVRSSGVSFAAYGAEGAVDYNLEGYDISRTLFSFSKDGSRIYAFVRDLQGSKLNLFTNSISESLKPSSSSGVDTGLTSYRLTEDSLIYLKADSNNITGDIFIHDGEKITKLSNAANAFTVEDYNYVIALKNHNTQGETADYYLCDNGEEKLIGSEVVVTSFIYNSDGVAVFITEDGKLCVYGGDEAVAVAEGVTEILLLA